jgi:ankyrin repeat protein
MTIKMTHDSKNSNSQPWLSNPFSLSWITSWWSSKGSVQNLSAKSAKTYAYTKSSPSIFSIVPRILSWISKKNEIPIAQNENDNKLIKAVLECNNQQVETWLIKGGNPNSLCDKYNNTPLHCAASRLRLDIVELLIKYNAKVNSYNNLGHTPLHYAARLVGAQPKVVEFLLKQGAKIDYDSPNDYGTPLHIALDVGNQHTVKLFIKHNAKINSRNKLHQTPLHLAAKKDRKEIVGLLLENNADINCKDSSGVTPLYLAAKKDRKEIVGLLLENNADINCADSSGVTPLHYAVNAGHEEIVELLLAKSVDINCANSSGATPLHYAAYKGDLEMVKRLSNANANWNIRNMLLDTPVHVAVSYKKTDICEYWFGLHQNNAIDDQLHMVTSLLEQDGCDGATTIGQG